MWVPVAIDLGRDRGVGFGRLVSQSSRMPPRFVVRITAHEGALSLTSSTGGVQVRTRVGQRMVDPLTSCEPFRGSLLFVVFCNFF